ncbi:hypothetical protein ABMA28_016536 [Loxostege sticticalis]|uniref:Reverse transcriptase domain-containing protein n=1 Tax=Loxostege sticticalis TaxID=481309 RepID=A0ABD0T9T8_LOXSC
MPDIAWVPVSSHNTPSQSSQCTSMTALGSGCLHPQVMNFMAALNATQYNCIYNTSGKILDLLISNVTLTVRASADPLLPPDLHHPPFISVVNMHQMYEPMKKRPRTKYNFYKADFDSINLKIENYDWSGLLAGLPSEQCVDTFYNTIDNIIKQHAPLSTSRTNGFPVWFSHSLITTCKNKQRFWIKWKKFGNQCDYEKFSRYRSVFKKKCRECYDKYMRSVEDGITKNVKHFWTYISNRKSKSEIPATMHFLNHTSNDPETICGMFSDFFQSVFEPATSSLQQWQPPSETSDQDILLSNLYFSESEILKELKNLDPSKGAGPDGLPPQFFVATATSICKPLHIIYNKCMSEGVFPKVWKLANITPIHKNESKGDVANYRPISILSTLSKLFERLVHNQIYPILHKTIIEEQHGFVKQRSTVTNLLIFTNMLFEKVDDGAQVDVIYTDFKKAFDRVDHEILLNKIAFNGIRGNLLRWFASYILNRSQKVVINGYHSKIAAVTSGVPQGSILGPLLFILFINDIKECFHSSKILLYADDLKAYSTIRNIEDAISFQKDLDRLSIYCKKNKLQLSVNKCHYISFTKKKNVTHFNYQLCNTPLNKVSDVRDLGIQLDSKLQLNIHIDNIIKKAYRMYGFVMRSTIDFRRPGTYIYLFNTLIRTQLEYAVPTWNPYYKKYVEEVERVQNKFLRAMHFRCHKKYCPHDLLLTKYKIMSLENRRKFLEAMILYKIVNNKLDCIDLTSSLCYSVPRSAQVRSVRNSSLFSVKTCRTNSGLRAPIHRMMRSFNDNFNVKNIDIYSDSMNKFKKAITEKLSREERSFN